MSRLYLRLDGVARPDAGRAPLLERVLARAERLLAEPDWRRQAFQLIAPAGTAMPAIAAAAYCGELGASAAAAVYLAAPVHCEAGMVSVRLPANGLLSLDAQESAELAKAFNLAFADGAQCLIAAPSGQLFCTLASPTIARCHDPQDVRGRDIGPLLPSGPGGAELRRLMSEIEMWLHEHALNRARVARGAVAITGLWLWGGGAGVAQLPQLCGWTGGGDALFGAWPAERRLPREPGNGVVVLEAEPGGERWRAAQESWLVPALGALRAGKIDQLDLGIGAYKFILRSGWSWRFWRRTRPWWEYAQ